MGTTQNINLFRDDKSELLINPEKTLFITGAGISCDKPSSLPTGYALTQMYLDYMLGCYADDFKNFWKSRFPRIAESVHADGTWSAPMDLSEMGGRETPRLEFIIGEMDKMDRCINAASFHNPDNQKHFHRNSSLEILRDFQISEPNYTHHRLSQFLYAGSEMITANWDVCLEKAAKMDIFSVIEDDSTHQMKAVQDNERTIYKNASVFIDKR